MWDYSEKVMEHYRNPKNVGSIDNADAIGEAGSLACGDMLKLYLKVDENGLYIDAVLQKDITDHVNIYNAIKSGLIDKQSFAFVVDEDEYDYDTDTRTIKKIGKIFDVSVVDQPFYNSTDVVAVKGADNDDFLEKRKELRKQHEEELKQKEFEERKNQVLAKLG